ARFRRYQSERLASQALIDILEANTDFRVSELDAENETIILDLPDGGAEFWFFGHAAAMYHARAKMKGGSPQDVVRDDLLCMPRLPLPRRDDDGWIRLVDENGVEVAAFESEYAWKQAERAKLELFPVEDLVQGYRGLGEIESSIGSLERLLASSPQESRGLDLEGLRKASELIQQIRERFASLPVLGAQPDLRQ
ncbi:MAG: hypothetical protein KY467_03455, partial [Gemmatimonadetes bacterium]|nr:hypothetical protein [Gemmatimonadota bacterium]